MIVPKNSDHSSCQKSAFSLIELLVVVSIIALLSGLLLSAIGMVRASSRSAVCMSNQRQIGLAASVYSNDWEGCVPVGQANAPERDDYQLPYWGMWFGFLSANLPDMEKSNVFICPSWVTRARINADPMPEPWRTMSIYACSYGTNGSAQGSIDPIGRGFTFRGTLVPKPSQNIYVAERMGIDLDGSLWPDPYVDSPWSGAPYKIDSPGPNTATNSSYNIRLSHRSRGNALFYDGHVEAVSGDQLLANPSPWWNP